MKRLPLLKTLAKIFFVLSMIIIVFTPGLVILLIAFPKMVPPGISFKMTSVFGEYNAGSITAMFFMFAGYCLFVYALYLFNKVLDLFAKRKIFDDLVIKYFSRIGQSVLGGLLLIAMPPCIYRLFTQSPIIISIEGNTLGNIVFTASLGLFFMVLSEVFQMAKNIKEENDLTV